MAVEILATLVGLFCTTVSSIVTFFLTRRKYNSEVDSQVVRNVTDAFEAYKKVVGNTIDSQNKKIEELQGENAYLKKQIELIQGQLVSLLLQNKGINLSPTE